MPLDAMSRSNRRGEIMTDAADPAPARARTGGINPVIYLFAAPAALTLMSGLSQVVDFSDLFHRLLRVWRVATHWAWDSLFGWIGPIVNFHPTPMQKDGLTLSVMFLGAGLAPLIMKAAAQPSDSGAIRRGAEQWLFLGALVAILGIFLFPYLGDIARAATVMTPGWLKPMVYVGVALTPLIMVAALAMLAPVYSSDAAPGAPRAPDAFMQALYMGFAIAGGSFFIASVDLNAFMPETRTPGFFGGVWDWMRGYWGLITSPKTWAHVAVQLSLAGVFAVGFALMYARNPRAVIRIVAIGVGLLAADRIVALAQPNLPGWVEQLEAWEQGLSATR